MLKIDNPENLIVLTKTSSTNEALMFILGEQVDTGTITTNIAKKSLKFTAKKLKLFGVTIDQITLDFNFSKKNLEIMSFVLSPSAQGKGTLKKWLKRVIPQYESVGITTIMVSANLQAGGYVWARMGFQCTDSAESEALADSILDSLEKLDIQDEDLLDFIRDNNTKLDLPHKLASIQNPKLEKSLKSLPKIKKLFPSTVSFSLGKVLLYRQSWDGKLNLKSSSQKNILNSAVI